MKIYRVEDEQGNEVYATWRDNGYYALEGDLYGALEATKSQVEVRRLLPPVPVRQVFGIGLNYRQHAAETGKAAPEYPVIFMKNVSAVTSSDSVIQIPADEYSTKVDYEGELAVVIGKNCTDATLENALDFVLGYTCANDVCARDWQKEWGGGQFCRGKSFNTFCPIGPCLVTKDEIPDPEALQLTTRLNNEVMQSGRVSEMIFSIQEIIVFLSRSATLPAGSVILTGTPDGVGAARTPPRFLKVGDRIEVEISGIGVLKNHVS